MPLERASLSRAEGRPFHILVEPPPQEVRDREFRAWEARARDVPSRSTARDRRPCAAPQFFVRAWSISDRTIALSSVL